jgi:hypothetical protein
MAGLAVVTTAVVVLVRQGRDGEATARVSSSIAGDSTTGPPRASGPATAVLSRDDSLRIAAAVREQMTKERQTEAATPGSARNLDSVQRALLRALVDSAMRDAKSAGPRPGAGSRSITSARADSRVPATPRGMRRVALLPVRDASARSSLGAVARALEDSLRRGLLASGFTLADDATLVRLLARQDSPGQRDIADSAGVGAIVATILTSNPNEISATAIVTDVWRNRPASERQGTDLENPDGVLSLVGDVRRVLDRVSWRSRSDPRRVLVFDLDNAAGFDSLTPLIRALGDTLRRLVAARAGAELVSDSAARATTGTEERRAVGARLGVGAMVAGSVSPFRSDSLTFRLSVRDMSEERTLPAFTLRVPASAPFGALGAVAERVLTDLAQINWGPKSSR